MKQKKETKMIKSMTVGPGFNKLMYVHMLSYPYLTLSVYKPRFN